ncbi:MAG: carboxypeptidase-like regulatory domain-containing protein [Pirellulales bacterium]
MIRRGLYASAVLLLAACLGCGRGTVNVKAQITLDGQPLEGATVTLIGTGETKSRPATGISDDEGNVQFTTFEPGDGVLPGEYKVLVSKMPKTVEEEFANVDLNDPEAYERMMSRQRSAIVAYTPSSLPRIYLNAAETPLSLTVPTKDEVVFALESTAARKNR